MNRNTIAKVVCAAACLAGIILGGTARGEDTSGGAIPDKATYTGLERERFMTKWLLLGPIPVSASPSVSSDEQEQKKAFGIDPVPT
jgi:hypothetical protein